MSTYRAVLIGNGNFAPNAGLARLAGPARDVERLASVLTASDGGLHQREDVLKLVDRSKQEILTALDRCVSDAASNQQLLVYFSGHGRLNVYNELFLCASDTRAEVLPSTGMWARDVNNILRECRARAVVLILDCCHSGAYELKGGEVERSFAEFQSVPEVVTSGRFLLSSTGFEQLSQDGPDGSVFTRHVIEALDSPAGDVDKDGMVSLEDVYRYARQKLSAAELPPPSLTVLKGGSYPQLGRTPRGVVERPRVFKAVPPEPLPPRLPLPPREPAAPVTPPLEPPPQQPVTPVTPPLKLVTALPENPLPEPPKRPPTEPVQNLKDLFAGGRFPTTKSPVSRRVMNAAIRDAFAAPRTQPTVLKRVVGWLVMLALIGLALLAIANAPPPKVQSDQIKRDQQFREQQQRIQQQIEQQQRIQQQMDSFKQQEDASKQFRELEEEWRRRQMDDESRHQLDTGSR